MLRRIVLTMALSFVATAAVLADGSPLPGELPAAAPGAPASSLHLGLVAGLGYESETGRPWAIVPSLGLSVDRGGAWALVDVSSAIPENFVDTAGLSLGWEFFRFGRASFGLESLLWWRSYGSLGDETRFGVLGRLDLGSLPGETGLFFRAEGGYSLLMTRFYDGLLEETDQDPLGRLDIGWRLNGPWTIEAAVEDFSRLDATLYLKTLFEFGAAYDLGPATIGARLVVKYTDFFTLTSYVDGVALRLTARVPLGDVSVSSTAGMDHEAGS
jgi:hypothetical protein